MGRVRRCRGGLLALDLAVFRRGAHEVKPREALVWSGVWIGVALAFNVLIWVWRGPGTALEFLTARSAWR